MIEDLTFVHVGATVADLDVAMADFARIGAQSWEVREIGDTWAFDFTSMRNVLQRNTIAMGMAPGIGPIELVRPDPSLPMGPQRRLLECRAGLNHFAYTTDDLERSAAALIDDGAHLYMFAKGVDDEQHWLDLLEAGGERAVLPELGNCYLRLPSGLIVELLARNRDVLGTPPPAR
jgi:hypothetical protein